LNKPDGLGISCGAESQDGDGEDDDANQGFVHGEGLLNWFAALQVKIESLTEGGKGFVGALE
jgi:hypothetical protein